LNTARRRLGHWPQAWFSSVAATIVLGIGGTALAQTAPAQQAIPTTPAAPAAAPAAPDDTPSIKLGVSLFADYSYQQQPTSTDAAGNVINPNSFNITRSFVNVTGNISHLVAYRVTTDATRETGTGSSLNGNMTVRLKFAYAQIALDDWLPKDSWIRFGMIQTPLLETLESVYRYRFQGTTYTEREGYMVSGDFGVSFHTTLPKDYGDVLVGVYNGDGYTKAEANDQKVLTVRLGVRPFPHHSLLKGWRVQGYVYRDAYMKDADRNRAILNTTFEHRYVNGGFDYLAASDKSSSVLTNGVDLNPTLEGRGWSLWVTPKKPLARGASVEAFLRYDHTKPGGTVSAGAITSPDGLNERFIGGAAYWFPRKSGVSAALLLDVERVTYTNWTPARTNQQKVCLHTLVSF
jgi:hypothetical protein